MNLGVSASTTGVGVDIAMPLGNSVRMRTGFTYMPRFNFESKFGVDVNSEYLADEDRKRRMMEMMENFTGASMTDNVNMQMEPTWGNFKLLFDFMPFRNHKEWNFTVGIYAGPSRIARAVNDINDANTLLAVNIYNNLYQKACKGEPMFKFEDSEGNIYTGDLPAEFTNLLLEARMMGMPLGTFADGDRAMMVPDKNHQAKAEMHVDKVRPYMGVGYSKPISRNQKFSIAVDAGMLLWGGKPHLYVDNVYKVNDKDNTSMDMGYFDEQWNYIEKNPQRIDLTRDVTGIGGKVGDWVKVMNRFKCYPMLSVTFSYKIF